MSVFLALSLLIVLLVALLAGLPQPQAQVRRPRDASARCPRTHAPAEVASCLRVGPRCYRVLTCSEKCAHELQKLAEASEEAFRAKYQSQESEEDESGLLLRHHVTGSPAHVAVEVPCQDCSPP